MRLFIPTLLCLLSCTANADIPVDGQDDNRFGGGNSGIASVEFNLTLDPYDEARSLLRQDNGKLVMLARARAPVSGDDLFRIALARFNADGTPDVTFSGDGKVIPATPNPEFDYHPTDFALAPDGKYVVLANRNMLSNQSAPSVMHVCRYNVAGNLDTSFNGSGCNNPVIGIVEGEAGDGYRMAVLDDGSVLVTGQVDADPDPAISFSAFVYKLTPQGIQDPVFGANLAYVLLKPPGCDWCTPAGIEAAADGGAYVFGSNQFSISWVAKILASGDLDPDFGVGGYALFSFANLHNMVNPRELTQASAMDAQGRHYHCGVIQNGNNNNQRLVAIARLTADGHLDTAFSEDGRVLMPFNDVLPNSDVDRCAVDSQDRLVVSVEVGGEDGLSSDYGVMRFLPNGDLDPNFNFAGTARRAVNLGGVDLAGHDMTAGLAIDATGVIVAGTSNGTNALTPVRKLTMVRFGNDRLLVDGFE
jgi:uncharacterized delta-60 repeat protein